MPIIIYNMKVLALFQKCDLSKYLWMFSLSRAQRNLRLEVWTSLKLVVSPNSASMGSIQPFFIFTLYCPAYDQQKEWHNFIYIHHLLLENEFKIHDLLGENFYLYTWKSVEICASIPVILPSAESEYSDASFHTLRRIYKGFWQG